MMDIKVDISKQHAALSPKTVPIESDNDTKRAVEASLHDS